MENAGHEGRAGSGRTNETTGEAAAGSSDLSSLLNYPSLGRLFEGTDSSALEDSRGRLDRTNQDLERVVRQGTKEDADRASRASRAVLLTLSFLGDLDQLRRTQPG